MKKGGQYGFVVLLVVLLASVVLLDFVREHVTGREILDVVEADDVARRDVDLSQQVEARSERQGNRQLQSPQQNKDTILQTKEDSNNINKPFTDIQPFQNTDAIGKLQQFLEDLKNKPMTASGTFLSTTSFSDSDRMLALEEVQKQFTTSPDVNVIIWPIEAFSGDTEKTAENLLQDLPAASFEPRLKGNQFIAGKLTKEGFEKLQSRPDIVLMIDRKIYPSLVESRPLVKADQVESKGISGKGISVCVLDTGVDYTHPNLGGCFGANCKVKDGYDFIENDNDPRDFDGHGTHVAGIVASTHSSIRGIAPGANIIAQRVLPASTAGSTSASIIGAAIDWCVNNAARYNIKVITMSLGAQTAYNPFNCPRTLSPSIQKALRAGIVITAASGNTKLTNGVDYPACEDGIISVGATYDANVGSQTCDPTTRADQITCYSNRGKNLDLLAPGSLITSTVLSGKFADYAGTSMATPHVAGAAALLFEQKDLRPIQVENILRYSGINIVDSLTGLTFPRLDTLAALNALSKPLLSIDGVPSISNSLRLYLSDPPSSGKVYLLMYSTATSPGILLPDNRVIPLTPNDVFLLTLTNPQIMGLDNSFNALDTYGSAEARFTVPSFAPPNLPLYFAFITLDLTLPFPQNIVSISEAVPLTTLPLDQNPIRIKKATLPTPRQSFCAENKQNNKIYCFGGESRTFSAEVFKDVLEYTPATDILIRKNAQLPQKNGRFSCAPELGISKIYCFGGSFLDKSIIEYDIQQDAITVKNAVLPFGMTHHSCVTSSATKKIYCFGGFIDYSAFSNKIVEYDPSADVVRVKNTVLPQPRNLFSCTESSFNQKIYCFGGKEFGSIVEYDPVTDTIFTKRAVFPLDIGGLSCAEHSDNAKIYCLGGSDPQSLTSDKIFEYNPQTDILLQKTNILPSPRESLSCVSYLNNKIFCFGGTRFSTEGYFDQILEYTPS